MCYRGEAHSIRLCDLRSANSWTLSINWQYFKGNSYSIRLCRVYLMPWRMPNSKQNVLFCLACFRMRHSHSDVNPTLHGWLQCYTAGYTITPPSGIQSCRPARSKGNFTLYQVQTLQFPTMEGVPFELNRMLPPLLSYIQGHVFFLWVPALMLIFMTWR